MDLRKIGHKQTEETKKKIGLGNKGKIMSLSSRLKTSETRKRLFKEGKIKPNITYGFLNKHHSKENIEKIRERMIGKQIGKNRIVSAETRKKLSIAHKGTKKPWATPPHFSGKNHPCWLGGKSFEPYTVDWTETLRRSIRERDKFICQICYKIQGEIAHDIHHIDYDKKNCDPNNLITLCHSCHTKTGVNREYWKKYFQNIQCPKQ